MTENVIIAIVGAVGVVAGAFAQQLRHGRALFRPDPFPTLHPAAYRLAQQMQADNALLWQWNRQLVDHIYKGLGPPPPEPPENLFDHDD